MHGPSTSPLEKKLKKVFNFLKTNRKYNHDLQEKFYKSAVLPFKTPEEKIASLLYNVANTQSQPRIDMLAEFYKGIHEKKNCLKSMTGFVKKINPGKTANFENLFIGMKKQPGWGPKTAALFTKNIYHIHNGKYLPELRIWDDVPKTIAENDRFYVPVDIVITEIFKKIAPSKKWDFNSINNTLQSKYKGAEIEIWDDLWFWGFITQKGSGKNRDFGWNENKYWTLKESDKTTGVIEKIKNKAEKFLELSILETQINFKYRIKRCI